MSEDLKPCPFCGGPAHRVDNRVAVGERTDGGSFIECTQCHASTAVHYDRKENLLSAWQRRTTFQQHETE